MSSTGWQLLLRKLWISYCRFVPWCLLRCDRPWRMYRRGRDPVQEFGAKERLYLRVSRADLASVRPDGTADANFIKFPDQSFNRSGFSEPIDALIPDPAVERSKRWYSLGVVEFPVAAIPPEVTSRQAVPCKVRVVHDPYDINFAHSETRVYFQGQRLSGAGTDELTTKVERMKWRLRIRQDARFKTVLAPLR